MFACVSGKGAQDFSDEHCQKQVGAGKGKYGHVAIEAGSSTDVSYTDKETSMVPMLNGTIQKRTVEVLCLSMTGSGKLTNEAGPPMKVKGSSTELKFDSCSPVGELAFLKCQITFEDIAMFATSTTGENSMTVEFKPSGKYFGILSLNSCEDKNLNAGWIIYGSLKAVPEGGILTLSGESTLEMDGSPASMTGEMTVQMAGGGNPIATTTTEP